MPTSHGQGANTAKLNPTKGEVRAGRRHTIPLSASITAKRAFALLLRFLASERKRHQMVARGVCTEASRRYERTMNNALPGDDSSLTEYIVLANLSRLLVFCSFFFLFQHISKQRHSALLTFLSSCGAHLHPSTMCLLQAVLENLP